MLTWGNSVTPKTSKMLSAALSVSTSINATLDTTESAFLVMRWCTVCTRKMLSLNYPQAFIKSRKTLQARHAVGILGRDSQKAVLSHLCIRSVERSTMMDSIASGVGS